MSQLFSQFQSKESISTAYDSPSNANHTPSHSTQRYSRRLTHLPSDWCDKSKGKESVRAVVNCAKSNVAIAVSKFDGNDGAKYGTSTPTSKCQKKAPDAPMFKAIAWDPQRYFVDEVEVANEPVPAKCLR